MVVVMASIATPQMTEVGYMAGENAPGFPGGGNLQILFAAARAATVRPRMAGTASATTSLRERFLAMYPDADASGVKPAEVGITTAAGVVVVVVVVVVVSVSVSVSVS